MYLYRMIVTDLDNTLLNDRKEITDYSINVLQKLQQNDILVVFATARSERTTRHFRKGFAPDYVIADNGASIHFGEDILSRRLIPKEMLKQFVNECVAAKDITCIALEAGDCMYTNWRGESWGEGWNTIYSDFSDEFLPDCPKISLECKNNVFLTSLMAKFPDLHMFSNSGEGWSQVLCNDCSKINGIITLAEKTGIKLNEIISFGDDYNDVEMLSRCGVGVAVENAIAEAKQAALEVCGSNNNDGMAKWLEQNVINCK